MPEKQGSDSKIECMARSPKIFVQLIVHDDSDLDVIIAVSAMICIIQLKV